MNDFLEDKSFWEKYFVDSQTATRKKIRGLTTGPWGLWSIWSSGWQFGYMLYHWSWATGDVWDLRLNPQTFFILLGMEFPRDRKEAGEQMGVM